MGSKLESKRGAKYMYVPREPKGLNEMEYKSYKLHSVLSEPIVSGTLFLSKLRVSRDCNPVLSLKPLACLPARGLRTIRAEQASLTAVKAVTNYCQIVNYSRLSAGESNVYPNTTKEAQGTRARFRNR